MGDVLDDGGLDGANDGTVDGDAVGAKDLVGEALLVGLWEGENVGWLVVGGVVGVIGMGNINDDPASSSSPSTVETSSMAASGGVTVVAMDMASFSVAFWADAALVVISINAKIIVALLQSRHLRRRR